MTCNQLNILAKDYCPYYTAPYNRKPIGCTHSANKYQTEGNCHPDNCPTISAMKQLRVRN